MFTAIKHFMRENFFSKIPFSTDALMYGIVALLVILGPLFFIPVRAFSVVSSKGFFVMTLTLLTLLVYGIQVLKRGVIVFPRNKLFLVLLLIGITSIIGSFFASSFKHAFFGYGFETTSGLFVIFFGLVALFSYFVVRSFQRIGLIYGGIVLVILMLAVVHGIRFMVGPAFANLGVLGGPTATLMGSWKDLSILLGFGVLFCVTTLELAGLKKSVQWIIALVALTMVIILGVMNITGVWIVLGLVSLILALYMFSFAYWDTQAHSYKKINRVPWFAMGLLFVSIGAIFFGGLLSSTVMRSQNLSFNDIRPSLNMTFAATKYSLGKNFMTGSGPNSFSMLWTQIKPIELSGTNRSQLSFNQGVGFIPTQMATGGIIGSVLWVVLFVYLFSTLLRKTRIGFQGTADRYFAITIGSGIVYLSIFAWGYVPGAYLLVLLAFLTGAFIGIFDTQSEKNEYRMSFVKDPRASFFGILGTTILIIVTCLLGYIGLRNGIAFIQYTQGMTALNKDNLNEALLHMSRAPYYAGHDIFHRQLALFALSDIGQIITKNGDMSKSNTSVSQQVERSFGSALAHAQAAVARNSTDYNNWILLGDVYRAMVEFGITDAHEKALIAYQEAQKLNPNDSTMILYNAQLALAREDTDSALEFIKESIEKSPTPDAYIIRAQIQINQQKFGSAADSLKTALGINPYNTDLAYQYGLFLLGQSRYTDAITALQQVIYTDKAYAVAYVYLGYAYEKAGDRVNADKVYEYVKKQFPGGAEAISAVKSGQIEQSVPNPSTTTSVSPTKDTSQLPVKKPVAPTPKK